MFFVVWGAALAYCVYELVTAPLIEDEEDTNSSTDTSVATK